MHIRLFPIVVVICLIAFVVRVGDIVGITPPTEPHDGVFSQLFLITDLNAQPAAGEEKKQETTHPVADKEKEAIPLSSAVSTTPPSEAETQTPCSKNELMILDDLSTRRKQLEEWERAVSVKENVLSAADVQLKNKTLELESLKQEVEKILAVYNEKEDMKIRSLVKIYENMKPKDAARIFEELDMDVLLQVVDKMKEARVAPVLADLSPTRAKEVTLKLANRKKIAPPSDN